MAEGGYPSPAVRASSRPGPPHRLNGPDHGSHDPMKTRHLRVAEFAEIYSGGTPSTGNPDYWDGDVAWVTPKDLSARTGVYIGHGERFISEQGLSRSSARLLPADTVILSSRAPVGYVALAKSPLATSQGCKNLRCKNGVAHPLYVYYLLKNSTSVLESHATGSTYKELSSSRLKNITFPLPENIADQIRIASILSAYDQKIDNNRRRIALLEKAVRLVYKEWFVNLRFPAHEHAVVRNGMPERWERRPIADVCRTVGGGTPSTRRPEYWDGNITWIVPSDVTKNDCIVLIDSERTITEKGLRESSATIVPADTILMTSRASVGYFALMDREVCTNQGFINIIPRHAGMTMYLLFNLMSRVKEIRSNAKGTTYPEISKGRFRAMDIVIPEYPVVAKFANLSSEVIRQIRLLKRSTLHLTQARDLLLPRLMSGRIPV